MNAISILGTIVTIADGVMQGLPGADAAYAQVKAMVAAGRDPTPEEWASLNAASDVLFAQAQGTVPRP